MDASQRKHTPMYLHVQDLVDAYIGPFATEEAAHEHYRWAKEVRGDSAAFMGIVDEAPDINAAGQCGIVLTPERDRAYKG